VGEKRRCKEGTDENREGKIQLGKLIVGGKIIFKMDPQEIRWESMA
jgi:hypothetical protein